MVAMSRMSTASRFATRPTGLRLTAAPLRSVVVRAEPTKSKVKEALDNAAESLGNSGFAQKAREVTDANVRGGEGEYITKTPIPAFTREREINVGRIAMLGFLSAVAGELVTHQGIIGQVSTWTGLSPNVAGAIFVGIIGWSSLAVLPGLSETFSEENQRDVAKRPAGPTQGATDFSQDPKAAAGGIAPWAGFTRENELFNGRLAQLGFLAALTGEVVSGHGPIGQVAQYLDIPVGDELYANAKVVLGLWTLFLLGSAAVTGNWGQKVPGDDAVY